jgi:hypothetical protein
MRRFCQNCRKDVDLKSDRLTNAKICSICGTVVVHASTQLQPGTIVGGFQVESEIGRGGMGIVYRAKQLNLERQVALKVLADDLARDEAFVDSFFREARAAASLSHPNIVQVFDAGSTPEGIYYFAMELVVGETLDTRIMRDGALNPRDALDIAGKIAGALSYAWQTQKLRHGDIKPDNIILNSSGGAKLADLGLAKFMHEEKGTGSGHEMMGTPLYAPPEVINGEVARIDCRSDMYSFGATLFHMLAGVPPFAGADPETVMERHLREPPPSLLEFNHELNPQVQELVAALLAKRIEDRPASWAEVEKMMRRIHDVERKVFHRHVPAGASSSPTATGSVPQQAMARSGDPAGALIKALVVVALVLGAAVLGFYLVRGKGEQKSGSPGVGEMPAPSAIAAVEAEWQALQRRLPANRNDASIVLEAFIAKHGPAAPAAARELLEKHRADLAELAGERDRRATERADLDVRLAALNQRISTTPATVASPLDVLREIAAEIEAILGLANRSAHLRLAPDETAALNGAYMQFSAAIMEAERLETERVLVEQARLEQERRDQAQLAREEQERKRQAALAVNASIDDYYLLIADFVARRRLATLSRELVALHERHQAVSGEILARQDFLAKTAIPAAEGFFTLFLRHQASFIDQVLPPDLATPQYRLYKVESFTDAGIRLYLEDERVKMGGNLAWSRIPAEQVVGWARERLAASGEAVTGEDQRAILAHLLMNNLPSAMRQAEKESRGIPETERGLWLNLAEDFEQAPREQVIIARWRAFREARNANDQATASVILGEIRAASGGSLFAARYREELALLSQELGHLNPVIPLLGLVEEAEGAMRDGKIAEALALAMSAKARHGGAVEPGTDLRARLDRVVAQAMDGVVAASPVKDIAASRIPFYYWEREATGDALAYARIVRGGDLLAKSPDLLASLDAAAVLDVGDWSRAAALGGQAMSSEQLADLQGRVRPWGPALAFARGLLAFRYDVSGTHGAWMAALTSGAAGLEEMPMKALANILLLEYALRYSPPRAHGIADKYPFTQEHPALEIRIALLHLLAILQLPDAAVEGFEKAANRHRHHFRKARPVHGDLEYLRATSDILAGNWDAARVKPLGKVTPSAPDPAARLLLQAVAFALANDIAVPEDWRLADLAAAAVSGNVASGELWQRVATYRLARSGNLAALRRTVDRLLNDRRLCALAAYPRLHAIDLALRIADGSLERQAGAAALARNLAAATVAAESERAWSEAIAGNEPQEVVVRLSTGGRADTALWAAVVAMIIHHDNPETKKHIHARIMENSAMLSWEERLLLGNLRRIP